MTHKMALNISSGLKDLIENIEFQGSGHFTGVEWWNMDGDGLMPFPVRYQVMTSLLQYGQYDSDSRRIATTYRPYTSLIADQDQNSKPYPISFQNNRSMRGCICYNITSGNSNVGLAYRFPT